MVQKEGHQTRYTTADDEEPHPQKKTRQRALMAEIQRGRLR